MLTPVARGIKFFCIPVLLRPRAPSARQRRERVVERPCFVRALRWDTGHVAETTGFYKDASGTYRAAALDSFEWLLHGFGTRDSAIPDSFPGLATLKQVHSADCICAQGRSGLLGQGDALIENTPGAIVAVKTADCIPILLVDARLRVVAAVHAGWRGTVAGIAGKAVGAMRDRYGSRPADLHAAIGPGIGECCYEVGPEVAAHFGKTCRACVNLADANRLQLIDIGVTAGRIYPSNLCTMCRAQDFHSFRRDRDAAGRMFSFVGIRSGIEPCGPGARANAGVALPFDALD